MINPEKLSPYRPLLAGAFLVGALSGCSAGEVEHCAVSGVYKGNDPEKNAAFSTVDQNAPYTWVSGIKIEIPETVSESGVRYATVGYQTLYSGPNVPQEDWHESRPVLLLSSEATTFVMGVGQYPVRFSVDYYSKRQRRACVGKPLPWFSQRLPLHPLIKEARERYYIYPNISYEFFYR